MTKQKKIIQKIPPPPSVLSRSSKMKAMAVIAQFPTGWNRIQKSKMSMTLEELKDDISRYHKPGTNVTGGRDCDFVMGQSCASGGAYTPSIPFEQQGPYGKWRMAGGFCEEGKIYDDAYTFNPTRCISPIGEKNGDFTVYNRSDCGYPNVRSYCCGGDGPGTNCGRWADSLIEYCFVDLNGKTIRMTHADIVWYEVRGYGDFSAYLTASNKNENTPSRKDHNWSSIDLQNMVIKGGC